MKNSYTKTIKIASTKENPVPLDILASSIRDIAGAMKKIKAGPVKERVIVLLIRDALNGRVTLGDIESVLSVITDLDKKFLK